MKNLAKALGLSITLILVGLTATTTASASSTCFCRIHCGDGSWQQISSTTGSACCSTFASYCGSWGNARCEFSNGLALHCPAIAPPNP